MNKITRSTLLGLCLCVLAVVGCSSQGVQEDRSINYDSQGDSVGFQHGDEGVFVAEGESKEVTKIFDSKGSIAVSSPLFSPVDKRLIFSVAYPQKESQLSVAQAQQAWDATPEGRTFHSTGEAIRYTCLLRSEGDAQPGVDAKGSSQPPKSKVRTTTDLEKDSEKSSKDESDEGSKKEQAESVDQAPSVLFEAACSHSGYVAANLAIRWRPDGQAIYFIDLQSNGRHALFEYDIASKKKSLAHPHHAEHLIFDWSPNGKYLCAVLADFSPTSHSGVWIRAVDDDQWWRAPETSQLFAAGTLNVIEQLRASRPAWTLDGSAFACVQRTDDPLGSTNPVPNNEPAVGEDQEHRIVSVRVHDRTSSELFRSPHMLGELHWRPDGELLGFVERGDTASLRFVDPSGNVQPKEPADESTSKSPNPTEGQTTSSTAANDSTAPTSIRRFVGWNAEGSQFAFVRPETPAESSDRFALLFPRIPAVRDEVLVANQADQQQAAKVVHSGVRITFPKWSPSKNELSLWGTYTPSHRSWLSMFLPWTLRPGDPAAVLNPVTGEMTWMAVNAHEQAQVGHYYLLKRDYEQAWEWYLKSAQKREPATPIKLSELPLFLRQIRIHQDPTFFEYICLTNLGREKEAGEKLKRFQRGMRFEIDSLESLQELALLGGGEQGDDEAAKAARQEWEKLLEFVAPIMQDSYAAEVFLSLDAADQGVAYFKKAAASAKTDSHRLMAQICLSQMHLAAGNHEEYVELSLQTLAPALIKHYRAEELELNGAMDPARLRGWAEQVLPLAAAGLALAPLASGEFLETLPESQLDELLERYAELKDLTEDQQQTAVIDLFRLVVLAKQGKEQEWRELVEKVKTQPFLQGNSEFDWDSPETFLKEADKSLAEFRAMAR